MSMHLKEKIGLSIYRVAADIAQWTEILYSVILSVLGSSSSLPLFLVSVVP